MRKGQFIFYAEGDDILGGTVLTSQEQEMLIQQHSANQNATTWLPMWIDAGEHTRRKESQGGEPLTTTIAREQIIAVGELTKGYYLTDDTRDALRAANIAV